ncbi:MAG: DUF3987 domain-containing protein [Saprospiraceae bacterium]|nr:DUF3987 domain-containing protein [Saprospiraceae bacterium]
MKPIKRALKELPKGPAQPSPDGNGHPPADTDAIAASVKEQFDKDEGPKNPFPIHALPKTIAGIANQWANYYNLAPDFYVAAQLAAAAAVVGNAFRIEFAYSYTEPLMLWNVIVGAPGTGKTPALKKGLQPVLNAQYQLSRAMEAEMAQYELNRAAGVTPNKKPDLRQLVTENTTFEALVKIMYANKRGVMGFHDEFMSFLKGMNAYKNSGGSDLEQFLKIFNSSELIVNRSSLDYPLHIRRPFITLCGGTQPGILHQLVDSNKMNAGLFGRIAWFYPDNQLIPVPSDAIPDEKPDNQWAGIIKTLQGLPTNFAEAFEPTILKMHPKAFKLFFDYKVEKEQKTINQIEEENLKQVHIKQFSYTLRLAGLLELLELCCNTDPVFLVNQSVGSMAKTTVGQESVERAILISDYLTANSMKVIARAESPISALSPRQKILYEKLPFVVMPSEAKEIAHKAGMSDSTAKRLLGNDAIFKLLGTGAYQKKFNI